MSSLRAEPRGSTLYGNYRNELLFCSDRTLGMQWLFIRLLGMDHHPAAIVASMGLIKAVGYPELRSGLVDQG